MNAETWVQIASPILVFATTCTGLVMTRRGNRRSRLHTDADTLSHLPPNTDAHHELMGHLAGQIHLLVVKDLEKTRDLGSFVLALVGAPALAFATVRLSFAAEWWSYLLAAGAGFLCLVFVYGTFESLGKAKRNPRGIRIE